VGRQLKPERSGRSGEPARRSGTRKRFVVSRADALLELAHGLVVEDPSPAAIDIDLVARVSIDGDQVRALPDRVALAQPDCDRLRLLFRDAGISRGSSYTSRTSTTGLATETSGRNFAQQDSNALRSSSFR